MARIISYPTISTVASEDLFPVTDISDPSKPLKNITAVNLQTFVNDGATLQRVVSTGNTYQASPSNTLWTWGTGTITATSTSFTSLLSSKRFKTTLIADGSYTDVLPNQINFNTAAGNITSITTNTALASNINLQWPSSSGILALTTDIISSPWDAVSGGINYAGGKVGIGTITPASTLDVVKSGAGFVAEFTNSGSIGHAGISIKAGQASTPAISVLDSGGTQNFIVTSEGKVSIGNASIPPSFDLDVTGTGRFTGTLTCQTLVQTSQRDQKKDIGDIDKSPATRIPFKEYKYKGESGERKRYGVVVEDIEDHYPELVHVDPDGIKGINYIDLLVKRVAELEKELEDISLTPGPKGEAGAAGKDGNTHLSNVSSIFYNSKAGKLEVLIDGQIQPLQFTPAILRPKGE